MAHGIARRTESTGVDGRYRERACALLPTGGRQREVALIALARISVPHVLGITSALAGCGRTEARSGRSRQERAWCVRTRSRRTTMARRTSSIPQRSGDGRVTWVSYACFGFCCGFRINISPCSLLIAASTPSGPEELRI